MNYRLLTALALLAGATTAAQADPASAVGRAVGSFDQAALQRLINSPPQRITVAARCLEEQCSAGSSNVTDAGFLRCRRGRQ